MSDGPSGPDPSGPPTGRAAPQFPPVQLGQVGEIATALPALVDEIEYGSGFLADLEDQFGLLERLSALQEEVPGGVFAIA